MVYLILITYGIVYTNGIHGLNGRSNYSQFTITTTIILDKGSFLVNPPLTLGCEFHFVLTIRSPLKIEYTISNQTKVKNRR